MFFSQPRNFLKLKVIFKNFEICRLILVKRLGKDIVCFSRTSPIYICQGCFSRNPEALTSCVHFETFRAREKERQAMVKEIEKEMAERLLEPRAACINERQGPLLYDRAVMKEYCAQGMIRSQTSSMSKLNSFPKGETWFLLFKMYHSISEYPAILCIHNGSRRSYKVFHLFLKYKNV